MPATTAAIPRFLLPQLTWKTTPPCAIAIAVKVAAGVPHQNRGYRSISSQATAWSNRRPQEATVVARTSIASLIRLPHRPFHTTARLHRDHHFDTLKFVQRLKDEGVSEDQAVAMMRVLSDVIEESIQNLTRTMVLREGMQFPLHRIFVLYLPVNSYMPSQTPNAAHTRKKSISPNYVVSSYPPTRPKRNSPALHTNA